MKKRLFSGIMGLIMALSVVMPITPAYAAEGNQSLTLTTSVTESAWTWDIPASLSLTSSAASKTVTIKSTDGTSPIVLTPGTSIEMSVSSQNYSEGKFRLVNVNNNNASIEYTIAKTDGQVAQGGSVLQYVADEDGLNGTSSVSQTLTFTLVNPENAKLAGEYKDTLSFTIQKNNTTVTPPTGGEEGGSGNTSGGGSESGETHSHVWTEEGSTVTTEPTCTTTGVRTYTCTAADCNETKTESIAALGHEYVDGECTRCHAAQPTEDENNSGALANYSWTQIQSYASGAESAPADIAVGQMKDGKMLVDMGAAYDGWVFLDTKNALKSKQMNSTADNTGGYAAMPLKTEVDALESTIKGELGVKLKSVTVRNNNGANFFATVFLPSATEVNTRTDLSNDGTKFAAFSDNASRKVISDKVDGAWWLRSAASDTTGIFYYVSSSGDGNRYDANDTFAAVPAFVLG